MSSSKNISTISRQQQHVSAFELSSLLEFSKVINSSLDLKFILGNVLLTIMGKMLVAKGMVLLKSKEKTFRVENVKGFSQNIVGKEIAIYKILKHPLLIEKVKSKLFPWVSFFKKLEIRIVLPLLSQGEVLGFVGLGNKINKAKFLQQEKQFLQSVTNLAATSIAKILVIEELRQVNRKLDRKVQELNTLFELSKEFNAVLDSEKLVKLLIFSLMGQIGVSKYVVFLKSDGQMRQVVSRVDRPFTDEIFLKYLCDVSSPVQVKELGKKSMKGLKETFQKCGMQVLVPMQIQAETKGVICLGEKLNREPYTQTDLEFLYSLGNLAIISLENARLFKETLEKQRLEEELLIAREIQKGLLPSKLPELPNFEIAAINVSSKQVGGDYYDVIPRGDNKFIIAIGDVSGKGTPASLLMANLQASIHALVPLGLSLSELTKRANDLMYQNTSPDRFVTFFWGILDTREKTFTYVNAGHNQPYWFRRDGMMKRLEKGGMILGVMPTMVPYEEETLHLQANDVIVMFTDGVSEAMNEQGEDFGEERLEKVIKDSLYSSAFELMDKIQFTVKAYCQRASQSDDITLVVLKVK